MEKIAVLIQKFNKNTGNKEWALVSVDDHSKILKWFGKKKPSDESVKKEEKRVLFFKNLKNSVKEKLKEKTPFDYIIKNASSSEKIWTKEEIKSKILSDDTWLIRGLLAIYQLQTDSEKDIGVTLLKNGIGFSGAHSEICSSFAKQYQTRGFLSPKQKEVARKIMIKYAGQLERIANKKIVEEKKVARRILDELLQTMPPSI